MSLLDKMLKAGSTSGASVLAESSFFTEKDMVNTPLPILNAAFSGELDGGFTSGLTVLAGESKTFKSALALYCMKAYLDKYKDGIAIFYDSEFGVTQEYLNNFGLDCSRIIHIPVEHIEHLKFDFVKKLDEIKKGDHVFFLVDSIGQIASKKETDDAMDEKTVADMTRAKALRGLLRLITVQLTIKDIPCIMINHVYQSIGGMYPTTVIPGGTSVTYSSNSIFVITKAQEKGSDGELDGWNFTINSYKSRFVKEKSKFPFTVLYDGGIQPYSGLLDLAIESGHVVKPKNGWYALVDKKTGEVGGNVRYKQTQTEEFLGSLLDNKEFKEFVKNKYKLTGNIQLSEDDIFEDEETGE